MENLNITLHYFWLIKMALILLLAFIVYRAVIVHKLKSKVCNILAIIFIVLAIVSPTKLSIDTQSVHKTQSASIEMIKELPPKVIDKDFENATKALKGITKEDIEGKPSETTK